MNENPKVTETKKVLKSIWPYVYRAVNGSVYFVLSLIKGSVKAAIEQMKGM